MNWQPIETAPKDGTHVLVWAGGRLPAISRYSITEHFDNGVSRYRREGWEAPFISIAGREFSPTHWMPLPEPPDAEQIAA